MFSRIPAIGARSTRGKRNSFRKRAELRKIGNKSCRYARSYPVSASAREIPFRRNFTIHPAAVAPLLDRHCAGREDLSRQLWGLLAFTLWFERYGVGAENRAPARI